MTSHITGRAATAVEVHGLTKTYPGGDRGGQGDRLRRRRRRGVRPARTQRRRQVDDDRDADDHDRADRAARAALAGYDVVRQPLQARSVSSVVFQEAVVDRGLTGRANLELHAQLWGVDPGRRAARIDELADALGRRGHPRPAGRQLQRRPAAAAGDRPRARVPAARAVPRRAHRRPGPPNPLRAARHDRRAAPARGDDDRADDALPRGGRAPLRPRGDHPRRRDRRARHARRAARRPRRRAARAARRRRRRPPRSARCGPASPARRLRRRLDADRPAARRERRRCHRRARRRRRRHERDRAPAGRPSTTSTCG